MNRADEDYLYPRPYAKDAAVAPLTLQSISGMEEHHFSARILPANEQNGKF